MRVFLTLVGVLAAALRLCGSRANVTFGPLPCHEFYAYCHRPYNSSRPGMVRVEGDQALAKAPQAMAKNEFRDHRCFCDQGCEKYGDCCLDAVINMDVSRSLAQFEDALVHGSAEEEGHKWECHTFPAQETAVYMIGSCPSRYRNAIILNRCKRRVPQSKYGYLLDLPVLSKKTNLTYVNVYCALCNDDTQLFKWELHIYCPKNYPNCTQEMHSWRYKPREKYWSFHLTDGKTSESKLLNVTYGIKNLDQLIMRNLEKLGLRKCRKDVISSCPDSWVSSMEKTLCQFYSLLVKAENTSKLYKNEYCAICNGEHVDRLLCPQFIEKTPDVTTGVDSYAVLLDFMGQGSHVGEAGVCGIDGLVCGFGELCDPLYEACIVYTCGRMYNMDADGKCVRNGNNNETTASDLPYLDSDCPKIYVTKDKFVRYLNNNSVYVNSTNQLYNISQYEVVNSSTILICTSLDPYLGLSWKFSKAQAILSNVCITLSLSCLAVHIVIHILIPSLLTLPGKNLLCLSCALFVAQVCFEFGIGVKNSTELCFAVGWLIHFGLLSTFMWMNVMAIDVFRTFSTTIKMISYGRRKSKYEFIFYSLYAWSTAFIIVTMAFTNDFYHWIPGYEPMYGNSLCWINNRQGLILFFAVPLAMILFANIILFTLSVTTICKTRKATKLARKTTAAEDISRIFLYIKLALIMGLTWIFGFVAAFANTEEVWYIFILLNCLQGAFIFIAFSCKRNVFRMLSDMKCTRICYCKRSLKSKNTSESEQNPSLLRLMTNINGNSNTSHTSH